MAIVPLDVEVDGHLLVLPKQHYEGIEDIPSDLLAKLMQFIKEVCLDLKLKRKFDGFNILNASGSAAQQSVPHFHFHILPRNESDGINAWPILPGGRNIYTKAHSDRPSAKSKAMNSSPMYDIVKFEADRSSELAALNRLLIIDEGHSNSMSEGELEKRMTQWLSSEYESYGIKQEGKIICYSLWRDDGEFHYMRQLYTVPAFRRRGIAKRLVLSLVGNRYSDKTVRLDVLAGNSDARIFYEKIDFQIYCHTMTRKSR